MLGELVRDRLRDCAIEIPLNGNVLITIVNRSGKRLRTIDVHGRGECSRWSPDGSKIAYCHHNGDGNFAVWLMKADGSGQRQASPSSVTQAYPGPWRPDGARLLFSARTGDGLPHVFGVDADGSNIRQLTAMRGSPDVWLPDGRIIFESWPSDSATEPHWFEAATAGPRPARTALTKTAAR